MYNKKYFTDRAYFAYKLELKEAVQELYYKILLKASRGSSENLLIGYEKKALDIGCAFGYVAELLKKIGYDVVGLDISAYAIKKAHKMFAYCDFMIADACHIPIRSQTFDLVTCFELIEHIPRPKMVIEEVVRLLKKDGLCVWTTPYRGPIKRVYDRLRGEKGHISLFKPEEIGILLQKYFKRNLISTHLLLPIPPQLLNKYFLLQQTPNLLSSEMWITSIKKIN